MKPKTEELLYFLLWSCEKLMRPSVRNLNESFEGWAYRTGLHRQIAALERQMLLESVVDQAAPDQRVLRLTETGRIHALGGRDLEACWRRPWDGRWRLVLFDLPIAQNSARDRLRRHLRLRGFGYLQNSVWISPDPFREEKTALAGSRVQVESLILLEGCPCAGETDEEIVAAAWNFAKINRLYSSYLKIIEARPAGTVRTETAARSFRQWANQERAAWLEAVSEDPLLPERLWPPDYLGPTAWKARVKCLREASRQIGSFRSSQ